ncbi:uncharacterized protein LOC111264193 isoform X2 [Varroa jacobsoni]|uniref:uncharacterized protein LOC111264193 isoform X2 n=1 Tax=Varroa jacobsoni TaxID=62625 RepID=UPI000BF8859A|nr:uncharacterized protein LOC111264193 isoform X2 [Varroa jacobsoni]
MPVPKPDTFAASAAAAADVRWLYYTGGFLAASNDIGRFVNAPDNNLRNNKTYSFLVCHCKWSGCIPESPHSSTLTLSYLRELDNLQKQRNNHQAKFHIRCYFLLPFCCRNGLHFKR